RQFRRAMRFVRFDSAKGLGSLSNSPTIEIALSERGGSRAGGGRNGPVLNLFGNNDPTGKRGRHNALPRQHWRVAYQPAQPLDIEKVKSSSRNSGIPALSRIVV